MKNILTIALLLAGLSMSAQQDETLFYNVNRIGVFGGPIFEFTAVVVVESFSMIFSLGDMVLEILK